jgi:hypothetical protein
MLNNPVPPSQSRALDDHCRACRSHVEHLRAKIWPEGTPKTADFMDTLRKYSKLL